MKDKPKKKDKITISLKRGRQENFFMETKLWAVGVMVLLSLISALGQYLYKAASASFSLNPLSWITNYKFIIAVAIYGVIAIAYVSTLKYGELSVLFPIFSLTYVWTILLAQKVLGESVSPTNWVGLILLVISITLIAK